MSGRQIQVLLLMMLVGAGVQAASAGVHAGEATVKYRNPTVGRELVYQIPNMHKAKVRRNLIYSRAGGSPLRMDVYGPRRVASTRLPVVLLGGPPAFRAGKDSGQKVGWAQLIAASGMAAVAFDIRSDGYMSTPEAPSQDVAAAIAYVRGNAASLGIDGERLCTLGFSLGTAPWHLWATLREPQPFNRCNAVYYGPLDLKTVAVDIDPAKIDEYSAITYLRKYEGKIPPMFVVQAGRDSFAGINDSIERFVKAALELGAPIELRKHPTGPHGFDTTTPGARSQAIIKRTLAFFRAKLFLR